MGTKEETFRDQVVVVTGGARGLGLGMATRFAHDGAIVVMADIDTEAGADSADRLRANQLAVSFEPLDVRQPDDSVAVVKHILEEHDRIDVWVNNAGISHLGPAENLSLEVWKDCLDVMLSGAFYCCQAVGKPMLERGRGVIVNVASVSGMKAVPGRVAYSVPKAGLIMMTQQLGVEWANRGVRVVGIAPAVVNTDMVQQGVADGSFSLNVCERRTPMRRLGEVDEITDAVLYLASDDASYVVGETLRVDGGWVAYQLF